jgi:hypothetical protein
MQSELKSLTKIFSETIFRIPDYQRGFSWGEKQLKDFWSDIEQLPKGKGHYTGVLTLEPTRESDYSKWDNDTWIIESKRYTPLYVVDGQQRLTTAVILIQTILERMGDDELLNYSSKSEIRKKYIFESKDGGISRSYIFGYEKDNPSYEFLKTAIFGEKADIHQVPEHTVYTSNLENAKKFFGEKLKGLPASELEEIFTKVTLHLQFNIFYIEPGLDVFVTFETMNNRGKPLSHLELLKNRLIYLSTKFVVEKSEREKLRRTVNQSWMTVYHYLGKFRTWRLADDVFLKTHFLCYFGPTLPKKTVGDGADEKYVTAPYFRRDEKFKDYLLDQVFTTRRVLGNEAKDPLSINDLHRYAQDIRDTVRTYYEVAVPDASLASDGEKVLLSQIGRLDEFDLVVVCVAIARKIGDAERRLRLLQSVERTGFLERLRPYYFSSNGYDMEQDALQLLAGDRTPEEISRKLEGLADKFVASTEFHDSIRGIGKGGYYSWSALGYFMYEYEQHLRTLSKTSRQLLNWETYKAENYDEDHKTIEHIYPQRALDNYWKTQFEPYSIQERNILRNSLGNLLPVSHPKNASLSNKSFALKKGSHDNQVGYKYGCLSEIQVSHEQDWGATEILRRGIYLLRFMEQRWRFSLGDDAHKADLLGLTFVPRRVGQRLESILKTPLTIPSTESSVPEPVRVRRKIKAAT